MKFLKSPILWLVIITVGVGYLGYKYAYKTGELQKQLYKKERKILRKHPYDLYALAKVPPKELWAVGSLATILHSSNGGLEWKEQQIGPPEQVFTDICFSDKNNGWIVGNRGCILHSSDQGQSWKKVTIPGVNCQLLAVFFVDPSHGWIVGDRGIVLRTTNGGKSWQLIETDWPFYSFNDVVFKDPNTGWLVSEGGLIMKTIDGGLHWQSIGPSDIHNTLFSIYLFDVEGNDVLWVGGSQGTILTSNDGGETWNRKRLICADKVFNYNIYNVVEQPYGTKYLGQYAGGLVTQDQGHNNIFALCEKGFFYSYDNGNSYRPLAMDAELQKMIYRGGWLADLKYEGVNRAWAVGKWGIILYTDNIDHWDRVH